MLIQRTQWVNGLKWIGMWGYRIHFVRDAQFIREQENPVWISAGRKHTRILQTVELHTGVVNPPQILNIPIYYDALSKRNQFSNRYKTTWHHAEHVYSYCNLVRWVGSIHVYVRYREIYIQIWMHMLSQNYNIIYTYKWKI